MRKKLGPVLGWLVATLASIALATSAVGSVRNEVTNQPSPLRATAETLAQIDPAISTVTPSGAPATTAGSMTSSEVTTQPPTTAATSTSSSSSTTTEAPQNATSSTTTTTTAPPTTTTTTAAPDGEYFETVQLIGGWVRLRVSGDKVFLAGSVPSPGFSIEIKEDGPESVVVEFESDSHESQIHAEVKDGELDIEKEEDAEH